MYSNALVFIVLFCLFHNVKSDYGVPMKDYLHTRFSLEFFKTQPYRNMAISPIMLRLPLCKLGAVADEKSQHELLIFLGKTRKRHLRECYKPLKIALNSLPEYDSILLNAFFVNESTEIDVNFYNDTIPTYGVAVKRVGFSYPHAAAKFINNWVSSNSFKRIKEMIKPEDIMKNTALMGVNMVYFKTFWEFPFAASRTRYASFRHLDMMTSTVPMMTGDMECLYLVDDITDSVVLEKKLVMWGGSALFVLPNSVRELPKLIEKLSNEDDTILRWKNQMKWSSVSVNIPRFQIKTTVNWKYHIKRLGIFNSSLSGLSDNTVKKKRKRNIYLSDIVQNVFIDVDEGHSEKLQPGYGQDMEFPIGIKNQGPTFVADRPFYFRISLQMEDLGFYDLVTGVYYGPEQITVTSTTTTTKAAEPE